VWRKPFFYQHQIPNGITTRCLTAILIICGILFFGMAKAQSVTETRQIKTTALQVYENYKVVMAGLYSNNAYTEDKFMALFEKESLIYNDILPDNQPQHLSPANYFKKFKASIRRINPAFSDFKMGEPVAVGNRWQIKCFFTRGTRFSTQKDMKYPEWSFNYVITIEMDKLYNKTNKVYENAKIISIDVENPLESFFVIENKENIPLVTKSGEILHDWDKEYQSRIFPDDEWKIDDIIIPKSIIKDGIFEFSKGKLSKNQTDAHFYQLDAQRFKKNIVGIGVNYFPVAGGNKINIDNIEHRSVSWSLSLLYGKQIYHKGKSTVFVNSGFDMNCYFHKYSYIDDAKDENLMKVKINNFSFSIPLSMQYLHRLTKQTKKQIFLSLELGGFGESTLFSNNIYRDAQNSDSFKDFFDKNKELKLNSRWNYGIFGDVGLWYAWNKTSLLKFDVSYKHSIKSPSLPDSTKQGMRNIGFGISWVKTIGAKKIINRKSSIENQNSKK